MRAVLQAVAVCLPVGYVLAAILHGMAFGGPRAPQVMRPRRWVLRATLVLHLLFFAVRSRRLGHFPVADLWTTISAIGFSIALLYAWLARKLKHPGSGGIVLGCVFVLQLLATAFSSFDPVPRPNGMGAFQVLHVTTSVLATSALILSGIHGLLYLILFHHLRERRFGALFDHLPSLDLLSRMTRGGALAGFICLTVGLNVGIWMAHREKPLSFNYRDPEVLLSILVWLHFGIIAFSGSIKGFSARRASYAAAGGLIALLLSMFLILFPALTFHSSL